MRTGSFYREIHVNLADHLTNDFSDALMVSLFSSLSFQWEVFQEEDHEIQKLALKLDYFTASVYCLIYTRLVCNFCFTVSTAASSVIS